MKRTLLQRCDPFKFKQPAQAFPIRMRYIDGTHKASVVQQVEVQNRKPVMRDNFTSGTVRQSMPSPARSGDRPTHFFSLRIPQDSEFSHQMRGVMASVVDHNAAYSKLLIPREKLHITASVATITADKLHEAGDAAASAVTALRPGGFDLFFRGLGTFTQGRVVFARIAAEQGHGSLCTLVSRIRRSLGDIGVDVRGNPSDTYVPHVTIAKIRPQFVGEFGKTIPRKVWAYNQNDDFGTARVTQLDLCEMETDPETGYYKVVRSISLEG